MEPAKAAMRRYASVGLSGAPLVYRFWSGRSYTRLWRGLYTRSGTPADGSMDSFGIDDLYDRLVRVGVRFAVMSPPLAFLLESLPGYPNF